MRALLLITLFAAAALLWATFSIAAHVRRARRRRRRELTALGFDPELPLSLLPHAPPFETTPFPALSNSATSTSALSMLADTEPPAAAAPLPTPSLYAAVPAAASAEPPMAAVEVPIAAPALPTAAADLPTTPPSPYIESLPAPPAHLPLAPIDCAAPEASYPEAFSAALSFAPLTPQAIETAPAVSAFEPETLPPPVAAPPSVGPRQPEAKLSPRDAGDIEEQQAREGRWRAVFELDPDLDLPASPAAQTGNADAAPLSQAASQSEQPPSPAPPAFAAETRGFPPRSSAVGRHPLSTLASKSLASKVERLDWAYFNKDLGDLTDPYEARRPPQPSRPQPRPAARSLHKDPSSR